MHTLVCCCEDKSLPSAWHSAQRLPTALGDLEPTVLLCPPAALATSEAALRCDAVQASEDPGENSLGTSGKLLNLPDPQSSRLLMGRPTLQGVEEG